jgi:CYTH domain-containing protein
MTVGIEIERKFLVIGDAWRTPTGVAIGQGYLNRDKQRTVRVRVAGSQAFLTIKGPSQGATRQEFEYPIPVADAQQLFELCDGTVIRKTRHVVMHDGNRWEIDEFHADNQGLIVAEIELITEDQAFAKPAWLDREVTDDPRYFNSNLISHPFCQWDLPPAS